MTRAERSDTPIASRGVQSLVLRGAEIGAQALLILVTARFLGPDGRGLYALASVAATLCVVPLGSVWSSLAIDVAKRRVPLGALATDAIVVAVLVAGMSWLLGDHWWVVALPAAICPVLLWLTYVQGIYQALGHVIAFHAVIVGRVVAPLVFLSAAIALGAGMVSTLVAWAASFVALVPIFVVHLALIGGRPERPARRLGRYARRVLLGLRFVPTNTMLLLNTQVGLLGLAALTTTKTVGVYSVAAAGSELLKAGARAVYSSVLPGVGRREQREAADLTAKAVRHSVLLGAIGAVVVVPASTVLLPLLLGPGYGGTPGLLALLVPAVLSYGAFLAVTAFFSVQVVRPELMSVASVLMLVSTILTMAVLVPSAGAAGAAVATSVGGVVGAGLLARRFLRTTGLAVEALVPGRAEASAYVTLARGAITRIVRRRAEPAAGQA